jgi:23S rRNA (guanosine2251-2'-O)-methyltransferase
MQEENYIYGIHAVEELLNTRLLSVDHIYFEKEKSNQALFNLMKICRKERLSYNLVPGLKLQQIANTMKHQGVVALCSIKPYSSIEEINQIVALKTNPLILIPASVEDPGNLGTIIRSSVAFGVDALILERKNTAPLNASVAKSSAGMIEHISIARPKNLEAIVADFALKGYAVIGADVNKGKKPGDLNLSGPTTLVLGGEHRGIPPYLDRLCTDFASIPINKKAQSLNVSAATATLLYECNRQRDFAYESDLPIDMIP